MDPKCEYQFKEKHLCWIWVGLHPEPIHMEGACVFLMTRRRWGHSRECWCEVTLGPVSWGLLAAWIKLSMTPGSFGWKNSKWRGRVERVHHLHQASYRCPVTGMRNGVAMGVREWISSGKPTKHPRGENVNLKHLPGSKSIKLSNGSDSSKNFVAPLIFPSQQGRPGHSHRDGQTEWTQVKEPTTLLLYAFWQNATPTKISPDIYLRFAVTSVLRAKYECASHTKNSHQSHVFILVLTLP